jgi:hypothetical protein
LFLSPAELNKISVEQAIQFCENDKVMHHDWKTAVENAYPGISHDVSVFLKEMLIFKTAHAKAAQILLK